MIASFKSDLPCGTQRFVALGRHRAAAIAEIRTRGLDAALEYVETLGGVTQKRGLARSIVKALAADPAFAATALTFHERAWSGLGVARRERMVAIPNLTWTFKNKRQIAKLETMPIIAVEIRSDTAERARRLP